MTYVAAPDRYEQMSYRRCGRSGIDLPEVSLGLWQNFGDDRPLETQRAIIRRAFDLGVTHFDLANNYGPPYGSAETNFGQILREDLRPYRDQLIISTKAGYDMWPGPYGDGGSRKYLLASLDASLTRMGLDYVDIFYSHRSDPDTPLAETMGALATAVRSGKALYAGISSYSAGADRGRRRDPPPARRAAADPSAFLLHAEPLDRGRPARHARPRGRGLHRVLAARAGCPDRQVRRWCSGGLAGGHGRLIALIGSAHRLDPGACPGPGRDRPRPGAVAGSAGAGLGPARRAGHLGPDRREQRGPAGGEPRRGRPRQLHRRRAGRDRRPCGRSRGSTSGRIPARSDSARAALPGGQRGDDSSGQDGAG